MSERFDAIVIGVGGMGSATLYHLARRGRRVLGLERYDIPHDMGSSHGITRIIRLAYYEHPSYVPLLQRSYELWHELEQLVGEQLLHITGSIDAGPPESEVFKGSLRSCEQHQLPHEVLDSSDLALRFAGYRLPVSHMALFQPRGGFLLPERCVVSHVQAAQALGAQVRAREQVLAWEPNGEGVRVVSSRGEYFAERLVITAGPWAASLIPRLVGLARPERQVVAWFQPRRPDLFTSNRFPVFNLLVDEGRFYGFPVHAIPGFKIGLYHHFQEQVDLDAIDRGCYDRDEQVLRDATERYFPDAAGPTMAMKTCMFTNSPDEHFILDMLPDMPQVAIAAGFSGHGFKFCSVVGEIMSDLTWQGTTAHDISLFRLSRFSGGEGQAAGQDGTRRDPAI